MFKARRAFAAAVAMLSTVAASALSVDDAREIVRRYLADQNIAKGGIELSARIRESKGDKQSAIRLYCLDTRTVAVEIISGDKSNGNLILDRTEGTWVYKDGLKRPMKISKSYTVAGQANLAEILGIDFYTDYRAVSVEDVGDGRNRLNVESNNADMVYQKASIFIAGQSVAEIDLQSANGRTVKRMRVISYKDLESPSGARYRIPVIEFNDALVKTEDSTTYEVDSVVERKYNSLWFSNQRLDQFLRMVK